MYHPLWIGGTSGGVGQRVNEYSRNLHLFDSETTKVAAVLLATPAPPRKPTSSERVSMVIMMMVMMMNSYTTQRVGAGDHGCGSSTSVEIAMHGG
jgi:hypothetical protein